MNSPVRILERPERMRFRVEDYELLIDGGAFRDYGKVELIDGEIWVVNPQPTRHARAKVRLTVALANRLEALGSDLEAISEVSVRVADDSMPEPDIVLTRFRGDRAVPGETVALAIEVSETTPDNDLGRKAKLYAAAGIPEYWVVDLPGGRVVVHEQPGAADYQRRRDVSFGEPLIAATVPGLEVATDRLVGQAASPGIQNTP